MTPALLVFEDETVIENVHNDLENLLSQQLT
jgi:hypothetical protein